MSIDITELEQGTSTFVPDEQIDTVVLIIRVRGTNPQEFIIARPLDAPDDCQLPSTHVEVVESPIAAAEDFLELLVGHLDDETRFVRVRNTLEDGQMVLSLRCSITARQRDTIGAIGGCTYESVPDNCLRGIGLSKADLRLMHVWR